MKQEMIEEKQKTNRIPPAYTEHKFETILSSFCTKFDEMINLVKEKHDVNITDYRSTCETSDNLKK